MATDPNTGLPDLGPLPSVEDSINYGLNPSDFSLDYSRLNSYFGVAGDSVETYFINGEYEALTGPGEGVTRGLHNEGGVTYEVFVYDESNVSFVNDFISYEGGDSAFTSPYRSHTDLEYKLITSRQLESGVNSPSLGVAGSNTRKQNLIKLFQEYSFEYVVANWRTALGIFVNTSNGEELTTEAAELIANMRNMMQSSRANPEIMDVALRYMWPNALQYIIDAYLLWKAGRLRAIVDTIDDRSIVTLLAQAFTRTGDTPFVPALDYKTTQKQIADIVSGKARANIAPNTTLPWEFSIGLSKFAVPPINISVNSNFKVTSITGGSIRQKNSPKFNTGHTETVVTISLYFPNHESIWGYDGEGELEIDFENDSEEKIDRFLSSLRGLVTVFKYSPFLPVNNVFLNRTFGMTGAALKSMTVQTLEGFPFVLAVNLTLLKFNHKAYLPMINDFRKAIHWGRYRTYMGAASKAIANSVGKKFLEKQPSKHYIAAADVAKYNNGSDHNILRDENGFYYIDLSTFSFDTSIDESYNTLKEFNDGKNFDIYFPKELGGKVFAPDITDWRSPGEDALNDPAVKSLWDSFVSQLGYGTLDDGLQAKLKEQGIMNYDTAFDTTRQSNNPEVGKILLFLKNIDSKSVSHMTQQLMQQYINEEIASRNGEVDATKMQLAWMSILLMGWKNSPYMKAYLRESTGSTRGVPIKEWEIPMDKMNIDWSKVIVNGVSLSMGNNIARLQLEMQEEPVHQHIGGQDTMINVSMMIFGEDSLIAFKQVFSHISGLAMLSHARGVLGFLGIKNVVTALCGTKYVLPLGFEVDSIPNYPHVYNVKLTLVDFDILQQKRERLDGSQQRELIDSFGKRNPFLRIKQLWGMFNAYPDLPLSVKDEQGHNVGFHDPSYYFREFQVLDDDIVNWGKPTVQQTDPNTGVSSETEAEYIHGLPNKQTTIDPKTGTEIPVLERPHPHNERPYVPGSGVDPTTGANVDVIPHTSAESRYNPTGDFEKTNTYQDLLTLGFSPELIVNVGSFDKDQNNTSYIAIGKGGTLAVGPDVGISVGQMPSDGSPPPPDEVRNIMKFKEDSADGNLTQGINVGGAKSASFSEYQTVHSDGGLDPGTQFQRMMVDTQYRDRAGSMLRAFPTYMLWLIDEGGTFAGTKLFDNFYGLQSVIDFSVVQSEEALSDTLILRISNMYGKLTTQADAYNSYNPNLDTTDGSQNPTVNHLDNLGNELNNIYRHMIGDPPLYLQELEHIRLRPGIRLHLRMGYGANPNSLHTVFNGVITEVQQGDIMTVIAQSDAIELSSYINTADKEGHSGRIDGSLNTGFWLSEPRDLIVRLLSMGSSTFREQFARATKGAIFSESKFGIRHFGSILYEPMTDREKLKLERNTEIANVAMQTKDEKAFTDKYLSTSDVSLISAASDTVSAFGSLPFAAERTGVWGLMNAMWGNSFKSRDVEIFKRNIYPGNGTGIMQFSEFDTTDTAITWESFRKTAAGLSDGTAIADAANAVYDLEITNSLSRSTSKDYNPDSPAADVAGLTRFNSGKTGSPIWNTFGLTSLTPDDDLPGYDEVSFRAQTYMRTVWDMFKVCADMIPNYIVAVRPFEDRSTVFYGKPHWQYTSGVIPLTTGIPKENDMHNSLPDDKLIELIKKISKIGSPGGDINSTLNYYADARTQNDTGRGTNVSLGSMNVLTLPLVHPDTGAKIPTFDHSTAKDGSDTDGGRQVIAIREMHLPTHDQDPTSEDDKHRQLSTLPTSLRYPFYMDRAGDPGSNEALIRGGYANIQSIEFPSYIHVDPGNQNFDPSESTADIHPPVYKATNTVLVGSGREGGAPEGAQEDPHKPGHPGAFGLVLSPLEEQWYCMTGDTMVSTGNFTATKIKDLNEGDIVLSFGDSGIQSSSVGKKIFSGKKKVAKVAIDNTSLECSYEHQIAKYISRGGNEPRIVWSKAEDLSVGDTVLSTAFDAENEAILEDEAYLLGALSGLSCHYNKIANKLTIHSSTNNKRNNIINSLKSLGLTDISIYSHTYDIDVNTANDDIEFVKYLSYGRNVGFIPKGLWGADRVAKREFINGYIRMSSPVTSKGSHDYGMDKIDRIYSNSKIFINQITILCIQAGYSISSCADLIIDSGFRYVLSIDKDNSYSNDLDGLIPATVNEISLTDIEEEMWDISVNETHNFIANGVVVHNCNMRWPYAGKGKDETKGSDYHGEVGRNRRMLVVNAATKRACVCVPGDWGPAYTPHGPQMGLSPDAMFYLAGDNGSVGRLNNLYIGWVDDNVSPGPASGDLTVRGEVLQVDPSDRAHGVGVNRVGADPSDVAHGVQGGPTISLSRSSLPADPNIEELFSSADMSKINTYEDLGLFTPLNSQGNAEPITDLRAYAIQNFSGKLGDFINQYGWAFDSISPVGKENDYGEIDTWSNTQSTDVAAATLFLANDDASSETSSISGVNASLERIDGAWKSFREGFAKNHEVKSTFLDLLAENTMYTDWRNENDISDLNLEIYPRYLEMVTKFMRFMWVDPYRRAWVAVVLDADVGVFRGSGFKLKELIGVWKEFIKPENAGDRGSTNSFLGQQTSPQNGRTAMDEYMAIHASAGSNSRNVITKTVGKIKGLFSSAADVLGFTGDLFSAVITGYRMQLAMMGIGIDQAGQMQRHATVLNRLLNDSIYYDPAIASDLVRAADNAFTREYNEPVIEVREPFERLHYLNPYQHILGNNISENLNGVKTVMTATSDGKYPVTVYFDKGASSERQVEGATETGLFWDNARGSGFFSFLQPIMHPLETTRAIEKETQGSSDRYLSKRIALARLKESLKNIYMGEVVVLGDAGIRPHDLIYLSDVYQQMYGMVTVEQVVHHFTPDQGFITSITPNALVTVNDPARWSYISYMSSWMGVKDMRDTVRSKLDIVADASRRVNAGSVTIDELHNSVLDLAKGSMQYTNGNTAIVKDLATHSGAGLLTPQQVVQGQGSGAVNLGQSTEGTSRSVKIGVGFAAAIGMNFVPFAGQAYDAWDWVKENLQDQHGLYIQYLNKNGQPMDAGLSYNQGVAVGQWYSKTILPGILNIRARQRSEDGHSVIRINDLMTQIGWTEIQVEQVAKETSWWVNQVNANILNASGFGPDQVTIGKPNVIMIEPTRLIDGDTIWYKTVTVPGIASGSNIQHEGTFKLRFSGINTPEVAFKASDPRYKYANQKELGIQATEYIRQKLFTEPADGGYSPVVAIRLDNSSTKDKYDRYLGVIFNSVPAGTPDSERAAKLYELASAWPINAWDSYFPDGRPYTLNWDLVLKGYANVYLDSISIGVKQDIQVIKDTGGL